jgi:hypothetical protein
MSEESIEGVFRSGKKLNKQLADSAKKEYAQIIKQTKNYNKEIQDLTKRMKQGETQLASQLEHTTKLRNEGLEQIDVFNKAGVSMRGATGAAGDLSKAFPGVASSMAVVANGAMVLSKLVDFLVSAFNRWQETNKEWKKAMGEIQKRTGATTEQFHKMRKAIEEDRTAMSYLKGDVRGIVDSAEFIGQLAVDFRNFNKVMSRDFRKTMLALQEGLGLSGEAAVDFRRSLESLGLAKTEDEIRKFTDQFMKSAEAAGLLPGIMAQDFNEAKDYVAAFGKEGVKTFNNISLIANRAGFSAKKLIDSMSKFNSFNAASDATNNLNAALGTTISSFELLTTRKAEDRFEIIRKALLDQGLTWDVITAKGDDYANLVAESLGVTTSDAARLLGANAISMEKLRKEQEANLKKAEEEAKKKQKAQEDFMTSVTRASTVLETIDRKLDRIMQKFSEAFGPIFELVNNMMLKPLNAVLSFMPTYAKGVTEMMQMVGNGMTKMKQIADSAALHIYQYISNKLNAISDLSLVIFSKIKENLKNAFDIVDDVSAIFAKVKNSIVSSISSIPVLKDLISPAEKIFDTILSSVKTIVSHVLQFTNPIMSMLAKVGSLIPSLKTWAQGSITQEVDAVASSETRTTPQRVIGGASSSSPAVAKSQSEISSQAPGVMDVVSKVIQIPIKLTMDGKDIASAFVEYSTK